MTFAEIKDIMEEYGTYSVYTKEYKRFKADKNREYKNNKIIEYLHCLIKNK